MTYKVRRQGSTSQVGGVGVVRRESASKLITDKDGKVLAVRKTTDVTDTLISAIRRASASSMSIVSLPPGGTTDPIIDATDALVKLGGKGAAGAYSEHLWDYNKLSEAYKCHIGGVSPNKS